jgi:hypothetical protein
MKRFFVMCGLISIVLLAGSGRCADIPLSDASTECIDCHEMIHPGIVSGWKKSRHARITPRKALAANSLAKRVSASSVAAELQDVAVGCAECHTSRPQAHADTFEHNGYDIHVVVSPKDCATCHPRETEQYSNNLMSHAYGNLSGNSLYSRLKHSIIGESQLSKGKILFGPPDAAVEADACYYCHGTKLEVIGTAVRVTELAGELEFPKIKGWPNQGVGRINLDGSLGSCSACHTRHTFSIAMARKPYTCKECHVGPDVPAYKVYASSKHGNIFSSLHESWSFDTVPWTIGKDFTAPTCATCHISLLVNNDEEVVVERTHQMNNRLPWRIYGLIYAHPHPQSPDTTIIRNEAGQPLPTGLDGKMASKFLIGEGEMAKRTQSMQSACLGCHGTSWVQGHWDKFENTIHQINAETLTATLVMGDIWKHGFAEALDRGGNPFDEAVEKKWALAWLFYGNSIRFASSMAGGGDYGVFAGGRYQLSQTIVELNDWLNLRKRLYPRAKR